MSWAEIIIVRLIILIKLVSYLKKLILRLYSQSIGNQRIRCYVIFKKAFKARIFVFILYWKTYGMILLFAINACNILFRLLFICVILVLANTVILFTFTPFP